MRQESWPSVIGSRVVLALYFAFQKLEENVLVCMLIKNRKKFACRESFQGSI